LASSCSRSSTVPNHTIWERFERHKIDLSLCCRFHDSRKETESRMALAAAVRDLAAAVRDLAAVVRAMAAAVKVVMASSRL